MFFSPKIGRDRINRHHWSRINVVKFYFVRYINRVLQCFRHIGKYLKHLFGRFQIFLFGIAHTARIVKVLSGAQTNQPFVRFAMFFFYKVNIVGG